jgi:mannosyltransferase
MLRSRIVPISIILLFAIALRLIALESRNLWYDEAFAVLFAEKGLGAMLYGTLTPVVGGAADIHPLLYYTTLNGWMTIFGESPFAVRLLSVIFGIATIYMMYLLGRDLFSERTGLAAALITAIVPFHVQYSQETRMYSLMALLLMGATWCMVRGWRSQSWRWWIAFGVLCGLAMYAQQLSAFYLVALGLVPFMTRQRETIIRACVGIGVSLIVYAPWLVNIPSQLNKVGSYYWIPQPDISRFFVTIRTFLAGWLEFPSAMTLITLALANILVIFLIIQVIFYLRRPRRAKSEHNLLLFVLWLFVTPVVLMWLFSQWRPVYLDRGLIPSALMLYMALAWLFTRGGLPRPVTAVLDAAGIVLVVIGLYIHYTWATFPNSPFREADAYIRANWQDTDVVVHQDKISALPMIYYDRELTQRYVADEAGASDDTLALPTQEMLGLLADACIQQAAQGAPRVWYITLERAEQESESLFQETGTSTLNNELTWLNTHYTLSSEQHLNDLNVYLFTATDAALSTDCE